jgi:hypothetical protein
VQEKDVCKTGMYRRGKHTGPGCVQGCVCVQDNVQEVALHVRRLKRSQRQGGGRHPDPGCKPWHGLLGSRHRTVRLNKIPKKRKHARKEGRKEFRVS